MNYSALPLTRYALYYLITPVSSPNGAGTMADERTTHPPVRFETHPDRYVHWKLDFPAEHGGKVARLSMDVKEERGLRPGYPLKLNSYDLGVDIELADAFQRIRFEHP